MIPLKFQYASSQVQKMLDVVKKDNDGKTDEANRPSYSLHHQVKHENIPLPSNLVTRLLLFFKYFKKLVVAVIKESSFNLYLV